ncbi:hypothetical protein H6F43_14435 [Leptolyngbya sp. FACHB-36]|uniref:hypothetical protein n=1 Tax=Leptolyngbya sp. FACHB-36 TaxID=2692808 RepID=UPI001681A39A|nr:hypothetical protein [Leptolyngbya sp. FACHB-36]MBD2021375.1 hypothetical protein [Leptolyngbya sp. FACHB-36]
MFTGLVLLRWLGHFRSDRAVKFVTEQCLIKNLIKEPLAACCRAIAYGEGSHLRTGTPANPDEWQIPTS